ncbi:MAG: serine hydrolase domain-containing protein [Rhodothermales bacterium]
MMPHNFPFALLIAGLLLMPGTHALSCGAQPTLKAADSYLAAEAKAGFSGTVLLVRDGSVVHDRGYGFANRDRMIRNSARTVYPLGSIVKLFTRDAIEVLRERGSLATTDPISRFFPDAPADKAGITIAQLMRHESGLDTYHGGDFEPLDRAQALDRIFNQELLFEPGSDRSYSNSGYTVLAAIVEIVSGESFPEFVAKELIEPAGLRQTGFYGYDGWAPDSVAIGYDASRNGTVNSPAYWESPSWGLMGGGGIASTADELYKWMKWRKQRFNLPPLTAPAFDPAKGSRTDQAALFAAGGGNWGYYAVYVEFGDGNAIVVLSNADDDGVEDLTLLNSLANILYGEPPLKRVAPTLRSPEELSDTPAGRQMQAFVEVVNNGSESDVRSFVLDHMDRGFQQNPDRFIGFVEAVRGEFGPDAEIASFLQPDPFVVKAFVRNAETGQWYVAHLEVDDRAPYPIAGLQTEESAAPEAATDPAPAATPPSEKNASANCVDLDLPDEPIGQAAKRFLMAVCTNDDRVRSEFVDVAFSASFLDVRPAEDVRDMLSQLHADLGRADVFSIEFSSQFEGSLGIEAENGERFILDLVVESEAPHRIRGFGIDTATPEVAFDSLEDLDAYLREQESADVFSGVVLVSQDGKVLFDHAYGYADKSAGRRNTLDTRFNIGSLNKLFTGVAVLKLAEQGKLDLDTTIGHYLAGFPSAIADHVTVRQLLQHRSGLGDYFNTPQFRSQRASLLTLSDYLAFIRDLPLEFEPGTSSRYSNAGYEVLGGIIEAVSGMNYYDYVQRHVYDPAGMTGAGSFRHGTQPRLAVGYIQQGATGYEETNADWVPPIGTAAGGGYATAGDLLAFQKALAADRLLSHEYTNLFLNRFDSMSQEGRTGDGGFAGGAPGVNAVWEFDLARGINVFVLSNFDPPSAELLARAIVGMNRMK